MRDDERTLLAGWVEQFTRFFGVAPVVAPLAPPSRGAPAGLYTITFPMVFKPPELVGGIGHFKQSPELVDHMRSLGFAWSDAGRIVTAPTPSSFNALLAAIGERDAGYSVAYVAEAAPRLATGPWLDRYLDGVLSVHVAPPHWYAAPLPMAGTEPWHLLGWHLTTIAHDLTVHALNYHLVPHACISDLGRRVRDAFPERAAGWSRAGAPGPLTLAYFFDNDLNRYCYAVWCRCRRPSDFRRLFVDERNYRQLTGALDLRIAETRQGKGDAPSGFTEDMPPLEPVEFRAVESR